eukprot:scaffold142025_cov30-Cyclotella_meneghiniana.AAC.1
MKLSAPVTQPNGRTGATSAFITGLMSSSLMSRNSHCWLGSVHGIRSGNVPITLPLAMENLGGFGLLACLGFMLSLQHLHTTYLPPGIFLDLFDSNRPSKPET